LSLCVCFVRYFGRYVVRAFDVRYLWIGLCSSCCM